MLASNPQSHSIQITNLGEAAKPPCCTSFNVNSVLQVIRCVGCKMHYPNSSLPARFCFLIGNIGCVQFLGSGGDGVRTGGGGLSLATGEQQPQQQRQLEWGRSSSYWSSSSSSPHSAAAAAAAAATATSPQLFATAAASSGFPSQTVKPPGWLQKNGFHSLMRPT